MEVPVLLFRLRIGHIRFADTVDDDRRKGTNSIVCANEEIVDDDQGDNLILGDNRLGFKVEPYFRSTLLISSLALKRKLF